MVKEAEQYAEEDAKRRETVETRNQADSLVYSTEKFLEENADKIPDDVKTEVQADVDALKTTLENDDADGRGDPGRVSPSSVSPARRWAPRCTPPRRPTRPRPVAPPRRPVRPTTTSSTPRSSTRSRRGRRRRPRVSQRRVHPGTDDRAPRRPPRPRRAASADGRRHRAAADDRLRGGRAARRPRIDDRGRGRPTPGEQVRRRLDVAGSSRADRRPAAAAGGVPQLQAPGRPRPRADRRERDVPRARPDHRRPRHRRPGPRARRPRRRASRAVADQLERVVTGLGLTKFGAVGRRVRPQPPRGPLPHRGGSRRGGHHLQGDRQGRLPDR